MPAAAEPAPPDALVIGAGAAGLCAARELGRAGRRVVVLEARPRTGGRIHTRHDPAFPGPVEAGAEFVHGELTLTLALLDEAGLPRTAMTGTTWRLENGLLRDSDTASIEGWEHLLARLNGLATDLPIADFLDTHFAGAAHAALRRAVTGFVEGYDAADPRRASTLALRDEWIGEHAAPQYRMPGGYGQLTDFLDAEHRRLGGETHTGAVVRHVAWQGGRVTATLEDGRRFAARQALVAVPLGVWQAAPGQRGHITYAPGLPDKTAAAHRLGFGAVVKVVLCFRTAFWETPGPEVARHTPGLGFLFSDATVPTWWTQAPHRDPVLTGWWSGPAAAAHASTPDDALLGLALASLAYLFGTTAAFLRGHLRAWHVCNWTADPFARGAYAYVTVGADQDRQTLAEPVDDTLFMAGEALYGGPETGTVEAALATGLDAARRMGAHSSTRG